MALVTETGWIAGVPTLACHDVGAQVRLPLILILHGFTGRKEDSRELVLALARRNAYAVAIDAHLHGELGSQPFDPAEIAPRMLEVATVTAGMIDPLIEHYASVEGLLDASRVGLIGTSLGGAIICHYLARRHPAVRTAVAMIAGIPAVWPAVLRSARTLFPAFGVTDAMVAEAEQVTYPPFLDGVRDFPLLLQYGEADPLIPVEVIRQVHAQVRERWGDPNKLALRTYPGVGHETPPRMVVEAMAWLARHL